MPNGKINLFGLGTKGVNNTKSPLHLQDGEFTQAQNALPDPRGEFGGIKTRDGLTAINGSAASGPIMGAVSVALPAVTTRYFYVGRQNASSVGQGWNRTSDAFATAATAVTTPGAPKDDNTNTGMDQVPGSSANEEYRNGVTAAVVNNKLYYASNDYVDAGGPTTTLAVIRVFDPVAGTDTELLRVPLHPLLVGVAPIPAQEISFLHAIGQLLYVGVFQGTDGSSNRISTVNVLNLTTGSFKQVGGAFLNAAPINAHCVPLCAVTFAGRLWVGTRGLAAVSGEGQVYWIDDDIDADDLNNAWVSDHELSANANGTSANSMAVYNGNLYVATSLSNNAIAARVEQRTPGGTWTDSLTGASATAYNGFPSLAVFKSNLYATYWSTAPTATIHKFNGSSWSTVFTAAGAQRVPMKLAVQRNATSDDETLYAIGYENAGSPTNIMLTSTDGSSWTDRSSNINDNNTAAFGELIT